ncbi:hypothetical protein Aab01nite_45610 [Paractinoplanes abujensis]|nr:hypothetical protein Aab01nite_45610 [Actinoplanes abujensis]
MVGPRDMLLGRALGQGQHLQGLILAGLAGLAGLTRLRGLSRGRRLTGRRRLRLLARLRRDESVFGGLAVR